MIFKSDDFTAIKFAISNTIFLQASGNTIMELQNEVVTSNSFLAVLLVNISLHFINS